MVFITPTPPASSNSRTASSSSDGCKRGRRPRRAPEVGDGLPPDRRPCASYASVGCTTLRRRQQAGSTEAMGRRVAARVRPPRPRGAGATRNMPSAAGRMELLDTSFAPRPTRAVLGSPRCARRTGTSHPAHVPAARSQLQHEPPRALQVPQPLLRRGEGRVRQARPLIRRETAFEYAFNLYYTRWLSSTVAHRRRAHGRLVHARAERVQAAVDAVLGLHGRLGRGVQQGVAAARHARARVGRVEPAGGRGGAEGVLRHAADLADHERGRAALRVVAAAAQVLRLVPRHHHADALHRRDRRRPRRLLRRAVDRHAKLLPGARAPSPWRPRSPRAAAPRALPATPRLLPACARPARRAATAPLSPRGPGGAQPVPLDGLGHPARVPELDHLRKLACALNNFENHRTTLTNENRLISKIFIFFIDSYMW